MSVPGHTSSAVGGICRASIMVVTDGNQGLDARVRPKLEDSPRIHVRAVMAAGWKPKKQMWLFHESESLTSAGTALELRYQYELRSRPRESISYSKTLARIGSLVRRMARSGRNKGHRSTSLLEARSLSFPPWTRSYLWKPVIKRHMFHKLFSNSQLLTPTSTKPSQHVCCPHPLPASILQRCYSKCRQRRYVPCATVYLQLQLSNAI
jgi:hypothetical protein